MTVETNNFEAHLHAIADVAMTQGRNPEGSVDLYERHAPSLDAPGAYEAAELFGTTTAINSP